VLLIIMTTMTTPLRRLLPLFSDPSLQARRMWRLWWRTGQT